jgi:hypothetical protein
MEPLTVSAQFAAYTWFCECHSGSAAEAMAFARENWTAFLGHADKGLGRLLIRLGRSRQRKGRKATRSLASVG